MVPEHGSERIEVEADIVRNGLKVDPPSAVHVVEKSEEQRVWTAGEAKVRLPKIPLGQWLLENVPRGANLELPGDRGSKREIPFTHEETK